MNTTLFATRGENSAWQSVSMLSRLRRARKRMFEGSPIPRGWGEASAEEGCFSFTSQFPTATTKCGK